jgi:CDP-glycerol glycerophosphotransferase (TagB/SpsB family)
VLKPHPSVHAETTAVIESLGENYDLTDYEIVEVDARDLITQSTLVIASYSSTAIEALAFGKPLICVPPKNRLDPTPFNDELVPKVQTEAELRQQIDSKLNFPDRDLNEFLDMFFYTRDGSAAENLSHVCARLAKQN